MLSTLGRRQKDKDLKSSKVKCGALQLLMDFLGLGLG
jgi:hypothetical protein